MYAAAAAAAATAWYTTLSHTTGRQLPNFCHHNSSFTEEHVEEYPATATVCSCAPEKVLLYTWACCII